jgi:hypothetical protein
MTRSSRHVAPALVGLSLLAAVPACTFDRPKVEEWHACIAEHASFHMTHGAFEVIPGNATVLYLKTRWDKHQIEVSTTDAELLTELKGALEPGANIALPAGGTGEYREGYGRHLFWTRHLEGNLRVLRSDPGSVELDVDVRAVEPVNDDDNLRTVRLRGKVKARRVSSPGDCR